MTVKVVTDSTSDIPASLAQELDITIVPQNVHFGQETFKDGVDLLPEEFYPRLVGSPVLPTTSQATAGNFTQVYEDLTKSGDEILSIHISSKLSGTHNSALLGRQEIKKSRIEVIDSMQVSMGLGLIVMAVAESAKGGANMDNCISLAHDLVERAAQYALCDTLHYLEKGGRVSKIQAFFGSILSVKPLMIIQDGLAHPLDRPRTTARGREKLLEQASLAGNIDALSVSYSTTPKEAEELASKLDSMFPGKKTLIVQLGPAIGVHVGPGALGLSFIRAR